MKKVVLALSCALLLMSPMWAAAQTPAAAQDARRAREAKDEEARRAQEAPAAKTDAAQNTSRFVRALTNVQIELTLTDQVGAGAPEKKTVSMIVASGSWGKIRSAGMMRPEADTPFVI